MSHIAIVDYGMGNFHSVARALQAAAPDEDIRLAHDARTIREADRVVFPGQGAMPDCMRTLEASGLRQALLQAVREKPLLGICVGEQMLFDGSAEGDTAGLGVFAGRVRRFGGTAFDAAAGGAARLKIPHMGWNAVTQRMPHPLWRGVAQDTPFYFVHSYYAVPADPTIVAGTTLYGLDFCCAIAAGNIFAVQFHPEKSAAPGLHMYRNFVQWRP